MCPLCSSTRATPLKIITTARRSVHTLMGSKEAFSTKTLPVILSLILRERIRKCQNFARSALSPEGDESRRKSKTRGHNPLKRDQNRPVTPPFRGHLCPNAVTADGF